MSSGGSGGAGSAAAAVASLASLVVDADGAGPGALAVFVLPVSVLGGVG